MANIMITVDVQTPLSEYTGITAQKADENLNRAVGNAITFASEVVESKKRKHSRIVDDVAVHDAAVNVVKLLRRSDPDPSIQALAAQTGIDLEHTHAQRIRALEDDVNREQEVPADVVADNLLSSRQLLLRILGRCNTLQNTLDANAIRFDNAPRRCHNYVAKPDEGLVPLAREANGDNQGAVPGDELLPTPFTQNSIADMLSPDISALLAFYGLVYNDGMVDRKRRLMRFLGVIM